MCFLLVATIWGGQFETKALQKNQTKIERLRHLLLGNTLPTNMAPVQRYLEGQFPLNTKLVRWHVRGGGGRFFRICFYSGVHPSVESPFTECSHFPWDELVGAFASGGKQPVFWGLTNPLNT